jgi:hypothetical protein
MLVLKKLRDDANRAIEENATQGNRVVYSRPVTFRGCTLSDEKAQKYIKGGRKCYIESHSGEAVILYTDSSDDTVKIEWRTGDSKRSTDWYNLNELIIRDGPPIEDQY